MPIGLTRVFVILVVISMLFIFLGCSKSTEPEKQLETIVSEATVVLDHEVSSQIVNVTNDQLIFPDNVDPAIYQPGKVIVSAPTDLAPDGILRKVESFVQQGGQIVVTTVQARLEDIFDQLDLDFGQTLRTTDITESVQLHEGVTFSTDSRNPYNFNYDIWLSDLTGDDGLIDVLGNLSLNLGYEFSVRIRFLSGLQNLDFTGMITSTGLLALVTEASFSQEHELDLYEHNFSRVWVQVGTVPVIIRPKVIIKLKIDASGGASVTTSIETNASVSAELKYDKPDWSQKSNRNISFDYSPPVLTGNLEVVVSAGPTFELNLYGVAGPFVSGMGYSKLAADINEEPWWKLWGGFKVDAGVNFDALGYQADYTVEDIIDYSIVIAYADTDTVAAPQFHPEGGSYYYDDTVFTLEMSCDTPGAEIRYEVTWDGNIQFPEESSPLYEEPLIFISNEYYEDDISFTYWVAAKAYKEDWTSSEYSLAIYTLRPNRVSFPYFAFEPDVDTYYVGDIVVLTIATQTEGATLRYTLNGSDPTFYSPEYTEPLTITRSTPGSEVIKAKGFKHGWRSSVIQTAVIEFIPHPDD